MVIYKEGKQRNNTLLNLNYFYHGPINHGLATPQYGKTITNNILPSSLRGYVYVSGDTVILSIGGSWLFPYRIALFPWITHWFVYSRKN